MRRLPPLLLLAGLLASCSTPPPRQETAHPAGWDKVQTGLVLLREGRTERAERAFQNAVLDARAADDAAGIAFAAYHLGAARLMLDEAETAQTALRDALAHAGTSDPLSRDIALLLADAAVRLEDADLARSWLAQAGPAPAGTPSGRQALLEARIAALAGDGTDFQKRAEALPSDSPDSLELKALAASRSGRHEQALALYLQAADLARASGRLRLLPALLGGGAEAAAALERFEEAAGLSTRAASAAYGQQRLPEAFRWLDQGADFAEKCPESTAAADLKRLFDELSRTVNEAARDTVKPLSNQKEEQP